MHYRETPFGYIVVLERGDELIESLTSFATDEAVHGAALSGLGAVDRVELGLYQLEPQDYKRRTYEEELEVCALDGTISLLDGEPFPHVHGVFGRADFSTLGGHVFEAVCAVTVELAVHTASAPIVRRPVDFCNLQLIQPEEGT